MISEQPTQRPLLGAFYMMLTGMLFVGMTAIIKTIGSSLPPQQVAFLRFAFGVLFFLPMLARNRNLFSFSPRIHGLFCVRAVCHVIGVSLWFYSLSVIPLADVTAMNYMTPIYVTLGAALVFGERIAWLRIAAIVVAFAGVIIILRPGFQVVETGHLAMLIGSVFLAGSYLIAKRLSLGISSGVIVAMMSFTVVIGMAPMAAMVWVTPTVVELVMTCAIAVMASAAHFFMTHAFKVAPMAIVQPVNFLQLVWAVALGVLMFDESLDGFVIVGGVIIVAAVSFIAWRETVVKRPSASE